MTIKEFDKLIRRDFDNGSVLSEIRAALRRLEVLEKENFYLKREMQRREDYLDSILT
jgi:hypothetical protein